MRRRHRLTLIAARVAIALAVALPLEAAAGAATAVRAGETTVGFDAQVLADLGIQLAEVAQTAPASREGGIGFRVDPAASRLELDARGGDFEGFDAVDLHHAGGFALVIGGETLRFTSVRATPADPPWELALRDDAGTVQLVTGSMHAVLGRDGSLRLSNADIAIAPALAARLGREDLAGSYVGVLDARFDFDEPVAATHGAGTGGGGCEDVFDLPIDVALIGLSGMTQAAREPGGRIAMAPNAVLSNVGEGAVAWYAAIAPDDTPVGPHPFLSLAVYRLADGVLEQIGRGDVKHAFFAVNDNCPCAGGHVLYPGCDDTYGVSTNLNRLYLAPRAEVDAHAAAWTSLGSHFDAVPVDDFRHHGGNTVHDAFQHRLIVREPDLQTPGARYFYEAWYLAAGDVDLMNSLGHRETDPTLGGSTWSFPIVDAGLETGSILDEWVDPHSPPLGAASFLKDTGEGRVQLAVTTEEVSPGVYHYEYALMNFDFDRQIAELSLPVDEEQTVSMTGFGDADGSPANDWTIAVEDDRVTWTAPAGNALAWGTLYNFSVEVDAAPVPTSASLTPLAAGGKPFVIVRTLGPSLPQIPAVPPVAWAATAIAIACAAWRVTSGRAPTGRPGTG